MCRQSSTCIDLGTDPTMWSPHSPLWPTDWFPEAMDQFALAYAAAVAGDLDTARHHLDQTRNREVSAFAIEITPTAAENVALHVAMYMSS